MAAGRAYARELTGVGEFADHVLRQARLLDDVADGERGRHGIPLDMKYRMSI